MFPGGPRLDLRSPHIPLPPAGSSPNPPRSHARPRDTPVVDPPQICMGLAWREAVVWSYPGVKPPGQVQQSTVPTKC
jgi:hypothetical protein